MLLSPQLLCLLGLMALGTCTALHGSPSAELKLERGSCPMFWFSFNGRCYKYIPQHMGWRDAESNCHSQGANLASVHSGAEHQFLLQLIQNHQPQQTVTWIGLHDLFFDGGWSWTDGSAVTYTTWQSGEPNGTGGNCVVTHCSSGGQWCDYPCHDRLPSVCVLRA